MIRVFLPSSAMLVARLEAIRLLPSCGALEVSSRATDCSCGILMLSCVRSPTMLSEKSDLGLCATMIGAAGRSSFFFLPNLGTEERTGRRTARRISSGWRTLWSQYSRP